MTATLWQIFFQDSSGSTVRESEVIVIGNDERSRNRELERITHWYETNANRNYARLAFGPPLPIANEIYAETSRRTEQWPALQSRGLWQQKTRPRGTGCIFRGGSDVSDDSSTSEDLEILEESVRYFMDSHRAGGEEYLFIGSAWDPATRFRITPVCIFEASSIELAADIVQLHFLAAKKILTLTEWACPIYTAPNIPLESGA